MTYKVFVFDSDGVLTHLANPLPGAISLLTKLQENGYPCFVLTNSSFVDLEKKHTNYLKMGIPIIKENILGASHVLKSYLKNNPLPNNKVWVSSISDPTPFLDDLGLVRSNSATASELGAILLLDDDHSWDPKQIAHIFNLLLENPNVPVIVPNPDFLYPIGENRFFPTSGAHIHWISSLLKEKGIHINPIFFGKPYPFLYDRLGQLLSERHVKIDKNEIVMIGDTPKTDIRGANLAGWSSILIKTGNYKSGAKEEGNTPSLVFDTLVDFQDKLEQLQYFST